MGQFHLRASSSRRMSPCAGKSPNNALSLCFDTLWIYLEKMWVRVELYQRLWLLTGCEAVYSPCLTSSPSAIVCESLGCSPDYYVSGRRVILDHVEGRPWNILVSILASRLILRDVRTIWSDMVDHGVVCMANGDLTKGIISGYVCWNK